MEFRVLAVGDVVGNPGLEQIRRNLRQMKRQYHADFAVVNGENAAVVGITPNQADSILDAGADIITMGNHTWSKREIVPYMDDCPWIVRPANYAPQVPGRGWQVVQTAAGDVAVIDLIGRCNMDYGPENPFLMVDKILKQLTAKIILVEIHAEATSEKLAMGYMLDGQVSAVWGTPTPVPTAPLNAAPTAETTPKAEPKDETKAEATPEEAAPVKQSKGAYFVSPRPDGRWQVKRANSEKVLKTFDTKAEAEVYAKRVATNQGSTVIRQKKDGKIQKKR